MRAMYAEVAIPRSAPHPLTYRIPAVFEGSIVPGVRVRVPLRRKEVTGVVVSVDESSALPDDRLRTIEEVLDSEPLLPDHVFELARFIADYYHCPLGTTLSAVLPGGLLRSDSELAEPTPRGAGLDRDTLPAPARRLVSLLVEHRRLPVAGLIARAGPGARLALDELKAAGLVRIRRNRRDRPPRTDVTAVTRTEGLLEKQLECCRRAPKQQEVLRWLAEQGGPAYETVLCSEVGCTPGVVRALEKIGLVSRFRQARPARPRWSLGGSDVRHTLTDEQKRVIDTVVDAIRRRHFEPVVLQGVTGSGKTEVYLRCFEACLSRDLGGIVLVPEIGLTPATVGAVERRFSSRVAVLHSAMSAGDRWREWQSIRSGGARIVVGPRSALFAPLPNPGLLVVDEEHDAAYKQQDAPRYHARDLALVLGRNLSIPVLLCSATPSTDAIYLEARKKARRLHLTRRVGGGALPAVELVDLRREPPEPGEQGRTIFSGPLRDAINTTLDAGHQVILLMQRRGWAPVLLCRDCGRNLECPACSVSLVVHRRRGDLECHYCGYRQATPTSCPTCSGTFLDPVGAGTEKVAHLIGRHFPGVTASILDRDTVRRQAGLETTLSSFADGRSQILVGTQMVAKGHHFPNVTLTGVISADSLLNLPDFRAGERTFQLLTQAAGRAGRGSEPGRVVVQTYYPDHPAVVHAARHDITAFTTEELRFRRAFGYPPITHMALVRWEAAAEDAARETAHVTAARIGRGTDGLRVRGPAPCAIERLRDRWRWQILLTSVTRPPLHALVAQIEQLSTPNSVTRIIDIDPLSTL